MKKTFSELRKELQEKKASNAKNYVRKGGNAEQYKWAVTLNNGRVKKVFAVDSKGVKDHLSSDELIVGIKSAKKIEEKLDKKNVTEAKDQKPYEAQIGMGDSRTEKEIRDQIKNLSDKTLLIWNKGIPKSKFGGILNSKIKKLQDRLIAAEISKRGLSESLEGVEEKLDLKKAEMGTVVKDFQKSDAPQFKGKSKEKRREMAVAAKLQAESVEQLDEGAIINAMQKAFNVLWKAAEVIPSVKDARFEKMVADFEKQQLAMEKKMNRANTDKWYNDIANKLYHHPDPATLKRLDTYFRSLDKQVHLVLTAEWDEYDTRIKKMHKIVKDIESYIKTANSITKKNSKEKDSKRDMTFFNLDKIKGRTGKISYREVNESVDMNKVKKLLGPTKNAQQGVQVLKKALGVSDKEAEKLIQQSFSENTEMTKQPKTFKELREGRGGTGEVGEDNIIMQLRKAQDVDGNHKIKFRRGGEAKVDIKDINTILDFFEKVEKSRDKREVQIRLKQSHESLKSMAKQIRGE